MNDSILLSSPKEIQSSIFNNCIPSTPFVISQEELKSCHINTIGLLLICKSIKETMEKDCQDHILKLKKICFHTKKYHVFNDEYLDAKSNPLKWKKWFPQVEKMGNPQLLDALSTGLRLPCVRASLSNFTPSVIDDIKSIVTLTPQSLNCQLGRMRCRDQVPPLFIACCNGNIPIDVIEFLLENGANPKDSLLVNNAEKSIISDISTAQAIDGLRQQEIYRLFEKYGTKIIS